MSTDKTIKQGAKHIRVSDNIAEKPVIIGHEFCAEIVAVSDKWKEQYQVGDKVAMPPVSSEAIREACIWMKICSRIAACVPVARWQFWQAEAPWVL